MSFLYARFDIEVLDLPAMHDLGRDLGHIAIDALPGNTGFSVSHSGGNGEYTMYSVTFTGAQGSVKPVNGEFGGMFTVTPTVGITVCFNPKPKSPLIP